MSANALAPVFLAAADRAIPDGVDLEPLLREFVRAAMDEAPIEVDAVALVRCAARSLDPGEPVEAALQALRPGDLALVAACLAGDAAGLRWFAQAYGADVDRVSYKGRAAAITPEEFRAELVHKLFVEPRRAEQYSGRADFGSWLRIVSARLVIDLVRARGARVRGMNTNTEDLDDLPDGAAPELDFLKERYRLPVKSALERAFAALPPRQRNVLRCRLVLDYSHDQVGALYGVHRTTAARWLTDARAELLESTKRILREEHSIAEAEFSTLVRLVRSRLHLSVRRILNTALEPEG